MRCSRTDMKERDVKNNNEEQIFPNVLLLAQFDFSLPGAIPGSGGYVCEKKSEGQVGKDCIVGKNGPGPVN